MTPIANVRNRRRDVTAAPKPWRTLMNKELENPTFLSGDFVSEKATRGAFNRRRRNLPTDAADSRDGRPTELTAASDDAGPRASRPGPLRRWSVGELIARAVVRPPTGGVAH